MGAAATVDRDAEVLELVETSGKMAAESMKVIEELEGIQTKVAASAPAMVQALITLGRIDATSEKLALAKLATPIGVLEVFNNLLDELKSEKQASEKQATAEKNADEGRAVAPGGASPQANGSNDNYLGRRTTEIKDSDRAIFGLNK